MISYASVSTEGQRLDLQLAALEAAGVAAAGVLTDKASGIKPDPADQGRDDGCAREGSAGRPAKLSDRQLGTAVGVVIGASLAAAVLS